MKKTGNWIWGVILILVGAVLGLDALGITKINIFFPGWWTLFIIIPSIIGLIYEDDKIGSVAGLVIGVMLMLACQDILSFGLIWGLILPVILIAIGVRLISGGVFSGKKARKTRQKIREGEVVDDIKEEWSIFAGQKLNFDGKKFTGTRLEAVFGGIDLDLTGAKLEDEMFVRASAVFGGIKIIVPKDVKVEVASKAIFGGVQNKVKKAKDDKAKKTLYLEAICAFGGVDIVEAKCSE